MSAADAIRAYVLSDLTSVETNMPELRQMPDEVFAAVVGAAWATDAEHLHYPSEIRELFRELARAVVLHERGSRTIES